MIQKLKARLCALRGRLAIERDARRWQRELASFAAPGQRRGGVVLFCDVVGSYGVAKAQSLYARAFAEQGYEAMVLLARRSWAIERIYRAAGVRRFAYLGDLAPPPAACRAKAQATVAELAELNDLVELEEDGVRVGRNVMSKTVRHFRVGQLDSGNAAHRDMLVGVLAESLATVRGAERLLASTPVRLAVFCERGYTPAGEIFDACTRAGIDAVQWSGAPMTGTLLFKRYTLGNRGMHPLSLSEETWRQVCAAAWTRADRDRLLGQLASHYHSGVWYNRQQLQAGKSIKDDATVRRELGLDPARKTAVIFAHILYDATFFFGDSLYRDYQEWLVESVRVAIENPHLNWVVKSHPVNVWRSEMDGVAMEQLELRALTEAFGELPDHIHFMPADTTINTYSLFEVADYALTVRGTIGLEMPCFGVPVVTAGTGRYSGKGFTIDPPTRAEYRETLLRLHEVEMLDEHAIGLAQRYAHATLFWRPLPLTSFDFMYGVQSPPAPELRSNVCLREPRPRRLVDTDDVGRMVQWALDQRQPDLLAPESDVVFLSDVPAATAGADGSPVPGRGGRSMSPSASLCPLCRSPHTVGVGSIDCAPIEAYWHGLGYDLRREFPTLPDWLQRRRCLLCDLGFFTTTVIGSPDLYAALGRTSTYYPELKWEFTEVLRLLVGESARGRLLEFGCGRGRFLLPASTLFDETVGIDFNPDAVSACRELGLSVSNSPLASVAGDFDAVVSFQVLEHLRDPASILQTMVEKLRAGGMLVLAVPNEDGPLGELAANFLNLPPHHCTRWTRRTFRFIESSHSLTLEQHLCEPLAESLHRSLLNERLDRAFAAGGTLFARAFDALARRIATANAAVALDQARQHVPGHTHIAVYRKVA